MAPDCSHNTTGPAFVATQEFFVTYCLTFVFFILCVVPFRVQVIDILCKLPHFNIFTSIFVKTLCVGNLAIGLYRAAHEYGYSQAPVPKLPREKCTQDQQPLQSASPLNDEYLVGTQVRQMLVIEDNPSLLAPLTIDKPECKETFKTTETLESTVDAIPESETLISQVTLLLGTTPSGNTRIPHRNMPEDISDILGTRVYQGYTDTPLQTSDGIIVNQPKWFLPLAEEVKRIAEEIRVEKINKQWAGIPREQLLNQSFNDQLNSIQILEQLAPLQLAKDHLPADIIDILERLDKVDNIPFNQLPDNIQNLHFHIDDFKSSIEKEFVFLKEATHKKC